MWGCFLMSGVKILHFLKDWWKSIPMHQNYTMALKLGSLGVKVIWSIGNAGSSPYFKNKWRVFLKVINYEMLMFGSVIWNKGD